MLSEGKHYCDAKGFYIILMFERNAGVKNMHKIEISYVSKKMLNQPFKNKKD